MTYWKSPIKPPFEPSIEQLGIWLGVGRSKAARIPPIAEEALARANSNPWRNTYLWLNPEWTRTEAERVAADPGMQSNLGGIGRPLLWGIPISVKDCFDLAGAPTSCGTKFYRDLNGAAPRDSWLVERLREAGAVITGKTHLHPLAYGITGENAEFGDCLQPRVAGASTALLTGGSSSGAAASVMEGSAMAAVGTDTGGSIRVPAAMCGLAGYRASLGIGDWRGAGQLAPSFDTMGWIFRHLEDGRKLAMVLDFHMGRGPSTGFTELLQRKQLIENPKRFAVVGDSFLHDCEADVVASFHGCRVEIERLGLTAETVEVPWWSESTEIFAAIQASEAAEIHRGYFAYFEPSIRQRLEWGAGMSAETVAALRMRHAAFRDRLDALLAQHEFLLMPAAPVSRLLAGADHSETRQRLLRYTTPVSLAGMPAVTIPCSAGGMQLVSGRFDDDRLLALLARIGRQRKSAV